jgi:hypothetical protein
MKAPISGQLTQETDAATADLLAEHTHLLVHLDQIGTPSLPGFDEAAILETIDRLHEIEAALPLVFPQTPADPDEGPF